MQYNTRTYKGKLYMICQNSIPDGKYWQNKECKNWSEVSARTTAVLCSACTMELLGPAETRQGYDYHVKRGGAGRTRLSSVQGSCYESGEEDVFFNVRSKRVTFVNSLNSLQN